jgi:hypothetical protein
MNRFIAAMLLALGCDSGNMMMMNTNGPLPGQPAAFVQSDTQDPSTIKPADLSCLGSFMDPAGPTATTAVDMTVKDFEKSTPVAGATVEAYADLAGFNAKTPIAMGGPTAADGKVTLMMPAGGYRVIFRTVADPAKTIETVEFNRAWNDIDRISVSQATKGEIPGLVSVVPDDTKGVVAGDLRDCNNKQTGGLLFNVSSSGGSFDAKANTFYFLDIDKSTTVPARSQKWTSGDGVFATLNVPPGDVTLNVSGLKNATDKTLTMFGTAKAPVRAMSITVVQLSLL